MVLSHSQGESQKPSAAAAEILPYSLDRQRDSPDKRKNLLPEAGQLWHILGRPEHSRFLCGLLPATCRQTEQESTSQKTCMVPPTPSLKRCGTHAHIQNRLFRVGFAWAKTEYQLNTILHLHQHLPLPTTGASSPCMLMGIHLRW